MSFRFTIDQPLPDSPYYRQRIPIAGWIYAEHRHDHIRRISVHALSEEIGSTGIFFIRPDVCRGQHLAPTIATGFRLLAALRELPADTSVLSLEIRVEFADATTVTLQHVTIRLLPNDFTRGTYGDLANPLRTGLLHREHIYSVGHPAERASPECVELLTDYLPPQARIMDVGCGIGAYYEPLQTLGFDWTGCEIDPAFLRRLAADGRPHRAIRPRYFPWPRYRLPARDGEFDAAIVIEVLEHIRRPEPFLRELARIARHRVLFSVPNLEPLPFLADRLVAPWHALASDHFNFFSRFNLRPLLAKFFHRVEIFDYGRQPLHSPDGQPLPYHLFAICDL